MVDQPDNKWSYGMSREPAPVDPLGFPPPADPVDGNGEFGLGFGDDSMADLASEAKGLGATRLDTGRFTSPSLGSYDPNGSAAAGAVVGTTEDETGYFEEYGYGEDFGDGRFDYGAEDDFDAEDDEYSASGEARRNAIEWAVVLVGAVLLALVLRTLLLQAFWIPSPSMESTLLVKDRVLVNKISYQLHDINRGDVIVFRRTDAEVANSPDLPRDVIKRVIALEGEQIEITNNTVYIDGQELREPYLDEGVITSDFEAEVVPEGHVFVMGDNRELSLDSRFETGPIAHDRVVGRAFFLFWPVGRAGPL